MIPEASRQEHGIWIDLDDPIMKHEPAVLNNSLPAFHVILCIQPCSMMPDWTLTQVDGQLDGLDHHLLCLALQEGWPLAQPRLDIAEDDLTVAVKDAHALCKLHPQQLQLVIA